jgi:hypothetical protein
MGAACHGADGIDGNRLWDHGTITRRHRPKAVAGVGLGSAFGFVYSGFDLGSAVAPLLLGLFIDRQMPHAVFLAVAATFALAAPAVLRVRRSEAGSGALE